MQDDAVFQYVKLFAENVTLWQILAVIAAIWLYRNRQVVADLPRYVRRFKIGDLEVELAEWKQQTEEAVAALENEIARERAIMDDVLDSFDPHAPVSELAQARQSLKSLAGSISDMEPVLAGLQPGAKAQELYAAAEILRTKRDPAHFDQLVAVLERLAADPDLQDVRLHTVWTLTSALHKTLISAIKPVNVPTLSAAQLTHARQVLSQLVQHPRVLADRPDEPLQGVRGPAKWADDWVGRGLAKYRAVQP